MLAAALGLARTAGHHGFWRSLRLPVQPPIKPMLATPVREVPRDAGMLFEPKWDGFRCLVFAEPGGREPVFLQSRTGKGFNRYFPEVVGTVRAGGRPVGGARRGADRGPPRRARRPARRGRAQRANPPAESRIRLLAEQTPAVFVTFDLLALDDRDLRTTPLATRRALLTGLDLDTLGLHTTAVTEDPDTAANWFRLFEGAGLDGVIGKRADGHHEPGKRTVIKVKHTRTADCVVAGLRWHTNTAPGTAVGSLLLGLHDDRGLLHHVGVVGAFSATRRRELAEELGGLRTEADDHPWLGPPRRGSGCPAGEPVAQW